MSPRRPLAGHLWVVGAGRLGLALGRALHRAGAVEALSYGGRGEAPPPHPLFEGAAPVAMYHRFPTAPARAPDAVIVAVPDDAVAGVGRALAGTLPAGVPVLHTSGVLGAEALDALRAVGSPVASLHPLAAVADPVDGAERLLGAWFALEGDPDAVHFGAEIARWLGGRLLPLTPGSKPLYHAAAVFASNYVVAVLAVAERLLADARVHPLAARGALTELAAGAVANLAASDPAEALTGPISRGDVETVRLHLERLSPPDRALYSALARATLGLAAGGGLDPRAADRLDSLLREEP